MNIPQFVENLFGIGKPQTTTPHPSAIQEGVNVAGKALDDIEVAVNTLQGVAPVLPDPFKWYVASLALIVDQADAYVDTIETAGPATGAVPQPPVTTPTEPPVVDAAQAEASKKTA